MPHEKKLKYPPDMPTLPLKSFDDFDKMESFLESKVNRDAMVGLLLDLKVCIV